MDGTLIDSMAVWEDIDKRLLAEYGFQATREISDKVKTMSIRKAAEFFIAHFGIPDSADYIMERIEHLVEDEYRLRIPEKPHALELISTLRESGLRLCIATATYKSLAGIVCDRLGFTPYLDFILTCSEVGESKNSPAIFNSCADRLGIPKAELAVAEDSLHSVKTASAAGYYTIAVYDEFSDAEWEETSATANASVQKLSQLEDILLGRRILS